jgi:hypothetical protein
MCNLYTHKMTAAEMRALMLHYQFHGLTWTEREERQRERNEPIEDVYPNKRAPVVVVENGEHVVREDMLWGFPKYKPGANWGTNFRTLKNGQWRPWLDREHRCIVPAAALRAKAFDMDVVFYDPYQPNGYQFAISVRRADTLAELMGQCDFISVHTPLTAETHGLIGAEAFAAAKRGVILINTARGPVVDIDALHDAMKDGTVQAAGLDVLPEEPANAQRRLIAAWQKNEDWIRHRLLLTPHSAFYTPESSRDNRGFAARTAARFLRDGRLENCVNKQFLIPKV